jgi:hypothetical protein
MYSDRMKSFTKMFHINLIALYNWTDKRANEKKRFALISLFNIHLNMI